jgi:predicted RNase H-like HicB family nuclease
VAERTAVFPGAYDEVLKLTIELDREEDGRWIAETIELPGVMCYGHTPNEAISKAERLGIEVIADRIAHDELPSSSLGGSL